MPLNQAVPRALSAALNQQMADSIGRTAACRSREYDVVQQADAADEAGASDGASQLIRSVGRAWRHLRVSGDDQGHGDPGGWGTEDGDGIGPAKSQGPTTRWRTLESLLSAEAVRERIRRALATSPPFAVGIPFSGTESKQGFVVTGRAGTRAVVGEVNLAGWDGGTQVHVAMPATAKEADSEVVVEWLRRVLR